LLALSVVCTAIIPQPMSTPTAAGLMAIRVGITLPTVAPMPQWTSGMAATQRWMKGRLATFLSWAKADASMGRSFDHARTGTP
jgi:hypothetical protein